MPGALVANLSNTSTSANGDGFNVALVFLVVGGIMLVSGWRRWRRSVRLADTPTVPPSAVPLGRVECTGVAYPFPGVASCGREPAVWYCFDIEKYVRRGKNSSWVSKLKWSSAEPFLLQDEHGSVVVEPAAADVDVSLDRTGSDVSPATLVAAANQALTLPEQLDPHTPLAEQSGRWRVVEHWIPVGANVTALGPVVAWQGDPARPAFVTDPEQGRSGKLYIADGDNASVEKRNRKGRWLVAFAPLLLAVGAFTFGMTGSSERPSTNSITTAVAVAALLYSVLLATVALDQYNRIVVVANQVESCWSMIDVALTRRSDLLPNLAAVAEAAMVHERRLHEAVAATRWSSQQRDRVDRDSARQAVETYVEPLLVALAETYPQMQSSANVQNLTREIALCEHRLASARSVYNDAVVLFRNRLETFPSSLFAGRFRQHRSEYWTL